MSVRIKISSIFSSFLFILAVVVAVGLSASHVHGQSAYFSFEGDISTNGDQHDFLFDLTRSVGSGEDLRFVTYTYSGGTNAAGDTIASTGFDSDFRLWDSLNVLHGQDDQSGPGLDALLSWVGVQPLGTPLNPDPLVADSYRLNLQEWGNDGTGALAVDLIGPADALVYTGTTITGTGTTDSLKFGTSGAGANVATYNHGSGTLTLLDQLVLAPTGNAALNLSGGTITAGGLTTINSGGTFTQSNGTFNPNGGTLIDGGTYQRTNGAFNIAAGTSLTVQNSGLYEWGSASLSLSAAGSSILVTGAGSIYRQTDSTGDSTVIVSNGFAVDATLGGTIEAEYLFLDNGSVTIDGSDSTLDVTAGNTGGFIHRVGANSGSSGALTLSNRATGSFESVSATTMRVADTLGSTGTIDVLSDADLTLQSLDLDEEGTSTVTVDSNGSTITQTAGSTLTVGSAAGTTGTLNAQNSGVFNASNTGTITINATGTLNANGGTFNAIGSGSADGGVVSTSGTVNVAGSGLISLNGGTVAGGGSTSAGAGGSLNVNGGKLIWPAPASSGATAETPLRTAPINTAATAARSPSTAAT